MDVERYTENEMLSFFLHAFNYNYFDQNKNLVV